MHLAKKNANFVRNLIAYKRKILSITQISEINI